MKYMFNVHGQMFRKWQKIEEKFYMKIIILTGNITKYM